MRANRRQFIQKSILGLSSLFYFQRCQPGKKLRKNVLFIIWDDQNDFVSLLNNPKVKTPHLEGLANRGVFFNHAYCAAPSCGPSRAALVTGVRPSTSGIYYNGDCNIKDVSHWIWNVITLPQHFRDNGYITGVYGKVFHAFQKQDPERYKTYCSPGFHRPFKHFWGNIKLDEMTTYTDFRK